jgi:hypothetical protein
MPGQSKELTALIEVAEATLMVLKRVKHRPTTVGVEEYTPTAGEHDSQRDAAQDRE